MDEVLATLTRRPKTSQHDQGLGAAPQRTTPTKHLTRRRSVFSLASDFFKTQDFEDDEDCPPEQQSQRRKKGYWNPFVSLQSPRDKKENKSYYATARGKSSSPLKGDTLGIVHTIRNLG